MQLIHYKLKTSHTESANDNSYSSNHLNSHEMINLNVKNLHRKTYV